MSQFKTAMNDQNVPKLIALSSIILDSSGSASTTSVAGTIVRLAGKGPRDKSSNIRRQFIEAIISRRIVIRLNSGMCRLLLLFVLYIS